MLKPMAGGTYEVNDSLLNDLKVGVQGQHASNLGGILANEIAKELGGYKVRLSLVHYSTEGMNLEDGFEFDPSRLTVKTLRNMEKLSKSYHLAEAMDIITSTHLDTAQSKSQLQVVLNSTHEFGTRECHMWVVILPIG